MCSIIEHRHGSLLLLEGIQKEPTSTELGLHFEKEASDGLCMSSGFWKYSMLIEIFEALLNSRP